MRQLFFLALILFAFTVPAHAANVSLADIENYLNGLQTLRARIIQHSSDGSEALGLLELQRPNRLRLTYDPPLQILLVADGKDLIYYDKKLEQVTYAPISRVPAAAILSDNLRLGEKTIVDDLRETETEVYLTVHAKDDPGSGKLRLEFSKNPLELRRWIVIDAQGIQTTVVLQNPDWRASFNPKNFIFYDPRPLDRNRM